MNHHEQKSDITKRFTSKGVFPYQYAFTLLIPLRNIFLSPRQLIKRLNLKDNINVLELGPGPGYFSAHIAKAIPNGHLVLADIQREMLDLAQRRLDKRGIKNVDYYLCDGNSFQFEDNSFDRIFMVTVIGEVEKKMNTFRNFIEFSKKKGYYLFQSWLVIRIKLRSKKSRNSLTIMTSLFMSFLEMKKTTPSTSKNIEKENECPLIYPVSKLILPEYPSPEGSRNNQFAPFRGGVNELIFSTKKHLGTNTDNHKKELIYK